MYLYKSVDSQYYTMFLGHGEAIQSKEHKLIEVSYL
jgi:hypothetical protein